MDSEEKNGKLKEELQSINDHLKKYTAPASNSGSDVIAEAMRKGKVNSDSRFYKDDDVLSNSSHSLNNSSHSLNNSSHSLNNSSHSHGIEPVLSNLDGSGNGKTNRVLLGRYADQDKVTAKQRFTTESSAQFRLHRTTPNGHKRN